MEMRALPYEAPNPPTLALCNPRDVNRPTTAFRKRQSILISARTDVGQQLNDRLRDDRNLTTVCQRAVFGHASDVSGGGRMRRSNERRFGTNSAVCDAAMALPCE
jgi:hypothetical protein